MAQETTDVVAQVGGWAGVIGIVGAGALYVKKVLSRDRTDAVGEEVDRSALKRLESENIRLSGRLEAAQTSGIQRPQDAIMIASLESENHRLLRDIRRAVRRLPPEIVAELETDFAALADVEERIEPKPKR
jgi:hypothetical protein